MRAVKVLWLLSVVWLAWTCCRFTPAFAWQKSLRGVWLEDRLFGVTLTIHQIHGRNGYAAVGVYAGQEVFDRGYYLAVEPDGVLGIQVPKRPGTVTHYAIVKLWR